LGLSNAHADLQSESWHCRVAFTVLAGIARKRDFLLDRLGRFFSWADGGVSATGRNWQICSLTANS
jgi:hypothetical protein